jgi:hypothetical protein
LSVAARAARRWIRWCDCADDFVDAAHAGARNRRAEPGVCMSKVRLHKDLAQITKDSAMNRLFRILAFLVLVEFVAAAQGQPAGAKEQRHPDVIDVKVRASGPNRFDFDVTVSSPYDTPQRYADAFRVADRQGRVFGERKLLHDHAGEQPFTRDLYGVSIQPSVRSVVVQARDQKYGYGGKTVEVALPGR